MYELVFDNDGREIKAVATITEKREFETVSLTIDSESSFAKIVNRFEPAANHQTRWIFDIEYRFKGLYKIVSMFFRKSMRDRADDEMRNFKQLVENRSLDD